MLSRYPLLSFCSCSQEHATNVVCCAWASSCRALDQTPCGVHGQWGIWWNVNSLLSACSCHASPLPMMYSHLCLGQFYTPCNKVCVCVWGGGGKLESLCLK